MHRTELYRPSFITKYPAGKVYQLIIFKEKYIFLLKSPIFERPLGLRSKLYLPFLS